MFRKTFIFGGLLIVTGLVTAPAMARDYCTEIPVSEWKPIHEISADASNLGYQVTGVEREGTCYEVKGFDRNGAKVKILYNPQTGKPATKK